MRALAEKWLRRTHMAPSELTHRQGTGVGAMRGRMIRLRQVLVLPAIVVGLASSLGATQCGADQAGTSSASAKKATGTVVKCDGARSCDVIFRRATTKRYEQLRAKTPP